MNEKTERTLELGRVVVTRAVDEAMKKYPYFELMVLASLGKHRHCDWGDTCEEDRGIKPKGLILENEKALKNGNRILSVYNYKSHIDKEFAGISEKPKMPAEDTIWIITEWDRSCTTVLFPEDY